MAKKDIKFILDTIDSRYSPVGTVKQLDSVFFYIKITENGIIKDLTGQTIKLFAVKGDKKLVEQTTEINITNETEGLVEIELLNAAIQVPGFTYFELEISDNTGIISTSDFILRVDRRVGSDEAIESTNEVATLKEIEIYVAQAKVELQRFKELQTEMLRTNEIINSNEEGRVSAEEKRVNSENKRALAEEERGTLFTQKEEERGTLFAQKEVERDDTFAQGERERNERFEEAESDRAVAESERVIAEQVREEKFAGFESKISSNTKELKAARSASTGEEFNSLDERIDCEVDRLNKKIEVSFLQQEDKENHTIENTVEGMTTDMVIKGRTLINIHPKSIYRFNAPSSEANKYTQDKSENSVIANITEEIASWCYVDCGAINRDMFKPNTKYTIIGEFNGIESVLLMDGAAQYSMTSQVAFNNNRAVVQIKSAEEINRIPNDIRIIIYCYNKKTVGTVSAKNVMILEGDWTNKPIPQYFENIKSFGQDENKISILSHGLNIVDISECKRKETIDNKECWVGDGYLSGGIKNGDPIVLKLATPLKKGDTVTLISSNKATQYFNRFQFFNSATNKVQTIGTNSTLNSWVLSNFSITTDSEYDSIQINTGGIGAKSYVETLFIGIGSVLNYKPYISDKKDISLSELGFDEGLRGLNSSVCDELNDIEDVTIKRIEKIVINDINISEIQDRPNAQNTNWFQTDYISNTTIKTGGLNINNKLIGVTEGQAWADSNDFECLSITGTSSGARIKGRVNKGVTSEQLKERLKGLIVYYELKEPVETPLSENINLKTFGEKTYVGFENSISGTSSFKAPVNTVATITRLNRENRALEEENRSLRQDFESTTLSLTDSDLELIKQNVDLDFRVMEIEFALDVPINLSNQNIKFINKKGEIKSMARTPYEMMKIVILSGDYDREDYMKKAKTYYDRGRMTKEEYDELVSLMTADEVINK